MANRLTDTTIWKKQKWFKKLSVTHKLAWKYLTDECDHAGVWKIDISELLDDLGLDDFDLEQFLLSCNKDFDKKNGKAIKRERITQVDEDHLWITGFMMFQYGGKAKIISLANNAVPSAIKILKAFNLFDLGISLKYFRFEFDENTEAASSPHEKEPTPFVNSATPLANTSSPSIPPSKPLEGAKDKDKDKDKDILEKDGVKGEGKTQFNTRPLAENYKELPSTYVGKAIELVRIIGRCDIDVGTVQDFWEIFKIQNLTGEEYYPNEGRIYSHFLNVIKKEKFTKDGAKQTVAGSQQSRLTSLVTRGNEKLNAYRKKASGT